MLNKLSNYLTDILIKNSTKEEDRDIYVYGWEMTLSTLGVVITIFAISIFFNCFVNTIFFLVCFMSIRAYAGGSHASSYLGCYTSSLIHYLVPLVIVQVFPIDHSLLCTFILGFVGMVLIFVKAPQDHPNKRLSKKEYPIYKLRSRVITGIWTFALILLVLLSPSLIPLGWWISVGLFQAGTSLLKVNK